MIHKNRKKKAAQLSYKQIIILCVLGLTAIVILCFSIYFYWDYQNECRESALREAESTAGRVVSQVDERLNNLWKYYVAKMEENEIQWLLQEEISYSDYSRYKEAYDTMVCWNLFDGYVYGFTVVNFDTGWVMNHKGIFPLEETVNREVLDRLFAIETSYLENSFWIYDNALGVEDMVDRKFRLTTETAGLNLVFRLPKYYANAYAMAVVNIDMSSWGKWIRECIRPGEEVLVADGEGKLIYSSDPALREAYGNGKNGILTEYAVRGGTRYMAAASTSGILGWKYYIFHDVRQEQRGIRVYWSLILLSVVVILLCFVWTVYMIYHPVGNLVRDVAGEEALDGGSGNELEFLAGNFRSLKQDRQKLQEMMKYSRIKLLEMFGLRLVKGEVREDEEFQEYVERFGLSPLRCYVTVVAVLNLSEEDIQDGVDEDLICLKLVEEMPEQMKSLAWLPLVYNSCTIFAILEEADEDLLLKRIGEYVNGLTGYAERVFGYRLIMGVSSTYSQYASIGAAYRESVSALADFHMSEADFPERDGGMRNCRFYMGIQTGGESVYDAVYEKEIQQGIKAMDKGQCYEAVDGFFAGLSALGGGMDERRIYILRFVNAIFMVAVETGVDLGSLYPGGLHRLCYELLEVLEVSRERRYVKRNLVDPILEARNELLKKNLYSKMERIEQLIDERKGDITLTEYAEMMGVHPTYIWKILKMGKGKSFAEYLDEYKVNEAKRLLRQTNLSVAEVAEAMNYANAQSFIRFFSKNTGVTPGKFRKLL